MVLVVEELEQLVSLLEKVLEGPSSGVAVPVR
jgi:hypothetical protein